MDQREAPILDGLVEYHKLDRYGFTPPGHRRGRGADPRTVQTLGIDTFRSDVLATAGLDDRSSSGAPGVPAVVPGERLNDGVLEYLRTGSEAGMVLPDPADPDFNTIRVVQE
ncbi:hypothetical protein KIH31_15860 [Paenarthrobacter sp. DKR-5]|uniref:hypothetical protein n=1 Tax=Paenarthrobacter sp. DKR-5 TaxID=2835535 RepID=UPI001BDD94E2|nr:hypothetical protein [Paenarthrobacter sp. DKR-5]MBT1004063.1 hypothetical protein [Paenarthrobacter sp. DKR-5]